MTSSWYYLHVYINLFGKAQIDVIVASQWKCFVGHYMLREHIHCQWGNEVWALPFIEWKNCRLICQEQEMTPSLTKHQLFLQGSGKGNKKELKFWEESQVTCIGEISIAI